MPLQPIRYDEPVWTKRTLLQGAAALAMVFLMAGLFLIGEEFGRQEVLHAVPLCKPNEYLVLNREPNKHAINKADLICLATNQKP